MHETWVPSPELDVLVRLAHPGFDDAMAAATSAVLTGHRESFNWAYFLDQAHRHKLVPLISSRFRRYRVLDELDDDIRYRFPYPTLFRQLYDANRLRNEALIRELEEVLYGLNQVGIVPVVRKGFALIDLVYRDKAMRPMLDIDLVVDREELAAAEELLQSMGYSEGDLSPNRRVVEPFTKTQRRYWRTYVPNRVYKRASSEPFVGLYIIDFSLDHFLPGSGYSAPTSTSDEVTEPFRIGIADAKRYQPETFLFDLLTHFYKEAKSLTYIELGDDVTLLKLVDIAGFVAAVGDRLDWQSFVDRMREQRFEVPCHYSLFHVNAVYPSPVLSSALDALGVGSLEHVEEYGIGQDERGMWQSDFRDRAFDPRKTHQVPLSRFRHGNS